MKKLFPLFALFGIVVGIHAQQIELTPQVGYLLNSKAYFYQGSLTVEDNLCYGLTIGMPTGWDTYGEFTYTRSDTRTHFLAVKEGYDDQSFDMATNYFMLSGTKQAGTQKVVGFGNASFGGVWYDTKSSSISDVWRFAFGLGGGVKLYVSDLIGLRFQGRILFPLYFTGGGMYYGIGGGGSGGGVYMSSTSTIVQGDLSVGLIFQLGEFY